MTAVAVLSNGAIVTLDMTLEEAREGLEQAVAHGKAWEVYPRRGAETKWVVNPLHVVYLEDKNA